MVSNTGQALWFAAGKLVSLSFTIVIAAALSRVLPVDQYGTYRQTLYIYGTLQVVFTVGLPRAYGYFLASDTLDRRAVVSQLNLLLLAFGALLSGTLFLGANTIAGAMNNAELGRALRIFSPIPVLLLPTMGIEGVYSAARQAHVVAVYHVITRTCMVVAVVAPVLFIRSDYTLALYGLNASSFCSFVVALFLKRRAFGAAESRGTKISYRAILSYSMPLMVAGILGVAFRAADKFYVSRYFGEAAFAMYANGFMDLPFVTMIATSTSAVLLPVFTRQLSGAAAREEVAATWLRAWKKSALIVYPLLTIAFVYAEPMMTALYGPGYADSSPYFRVALVKNFFAIITFAPLIMAMGETRFYSVVHLVVAVLAWAGAFFVAELGGTPLMCAMLIAGLEIAKAIWFVAFIARQFSVRLSQFVPSAEIARVLVHACIVAISCHLLVALLGYSDIAGAALAIPLYGLLLLSTAGIFGINYFEVLGPLLQGRVRKLLR